MHKVTQERGANTRDRSTGTRRGTDGISKLEVLVLVLVILAIAWAAYRAVTPTATGVQSTTTVKVRQSQTLWDLAAEYRVSDSTTAETVELIKSINGMTDSALAVGQTVQVPLDVSQSASVASR